MNKTISVIGGDLRQLTLAELLSYDGYDVTVSGFGKDSKSDKYKTEPDIRKALSGDVIILPMPAFRDEERLNAPFNRGDILLSDLKQYIKPSAVILGGRIGEELTKHFSSHTVIDYSNRDELMIKNAVPTAEGAIEIAMTETPVTIASSNCLVIGYGRIGKVLSGLLDKLGANVSVSARRYSDLAWIDVNGYIPVHNKDLANNIEKYDVIFNTVPSPVLKGEVLKKIKPDTVIIDLASKPGGVDFPLAGEYGLKVIWALSLPGKTAPITSGKIIKETVENILYEEGILPQY